MIKRVTDTSLKRRFIGAMALYLVISLILATYALSINRQQNESLDWSGRMFTAYESLQTAQTELSNARRGARAYLLYGDSAGLAQYQAGRVRYEEELAEAEAIFRSLTPDDSEILARFSALDEEITRWVEQDIGPSIALRQGWTGDRESLQEATLAWAQSPDISAYYIEMSGEFGALIGLARNALVSEVGEVGSQNTLLTRILISTLVAMTVFAIIGTIALYREIARPLERLARAARGIELGDFSRRAGITSRNEIGVAAGAFDAMAERVQGLVGDLRLAQQELAEREAGLRAVIENVGDALISIDLDDRIVMLNRRNRERFGIGEAELLGRTLEEAAVQFQRVFTDVTPLVAAIRAPVDQRSPARSALLRQYWPVDREFGLVVLPVTEDGGDLIGKLCVLRDISAERAADRMKSDFIALVSHELRTPLTSIQGYVELLLEEEEFGPVPPDQKDVLGIVLDSALRLVTLTNDLLDIARIESGRLDVRPVPMDAGPRLHRVTDTLRAQIDGKKQRLTLDLPADLPRIQADPNRFTQVMLNLVSNAHKYTPAGGSITVRAVPNGDAVRFEIEDTGIGLSEDEQSRLFSRFYRVQNAATQAEIGTGLGLAISKTLVEAQGGTIGVRSRPGEGSTFSVTLPASEPAAG